MKNIKKRIDIKMITNTDRLYQLLSTSNQNYNKILMFKTAN